MDDQELMTLSFIVRIWTEEGFGPEDASTWRGYVTHVPSGARCYLHSLSDVTRFIGSHLALLGIAVERS